MSEYNMPDGAHDHQHETGHIEDPPDEMPDDLGPCSTHGRMNCLECYDLDIGRYSRRGRMSLRLYQSSCVDTLIEKHADGVCGQVVSLPTGSGKTRIASSLPYRFAKIHRMKNMARTLFIVPADELVWQSRDKFREANPDFSIGVEKADLQATDDHDIVVASIHSISRPARLQRYRRDGFQCVGIDELHRGVSEMYLRVLRHFRALKSEPDYNPDTLSTA